VHSTNRNRPSKAGKIRIIAGRWRGRRIAVPDRPGLRPTPDRVRETLFNWLGQRLDGCTCLDLFAGSGALGFEAASRGAARVVMVESDRVALEALRASQARLQAAEAEIVAGSGALGFEAASRGAARVVMVEHDRAAFQALQRSQELLQAEPVELVLDDAAAYLKRSGADFDVVFLDPPFRQNALAAVFRHLKPKRGMRVYVESDEPVALPAPWHEVKRARAGQVSYQLLEWRGDDQGGLPGNV
jgi:16S rRNA (guanine966-N2)-methyltransferase